MKMNKQQLASKIWESANKMRSKIEANEYKDYILGFIFYKYLSNNEEKALRELGFKDDDMKLVVEGSEYVRTIQDKIGYFIDYNNLFSTWKGTKDFSVSNVRDGLSAFSRLISKSHKKVFDGIFNTLETGLSKLGDTTQNQTKAIKELINLIDSIPMDNKQDYDVLGFIYEYLISNFAANAGKKAGEFYTPHEVSLLMSEIIAYHLRNRETIKIYDPTSGSGSLLINIGKTASKYIKGDNKIKYFAQELKQNTYNLTRMNLVMRGIIPDNIITRNGDTLEDDWPMLNDRGEYEYLSVDAVVSNPPYSQNWDPKDRESDSRYKDYGIAPKSKADYAFLLHDLYHLESDGIMTIVLPHGVLFRGKEEGEIRKTLIEKGNIEAIIGLPANIFFGTSIPTIIMVLKKQRDSKNILFIDASKGFIKDGKNNKLRSCDIKRIVDTVINKDSIPNYSRLVEIEEIRENDYNLNIPRYIDSSEKVENYDVYSILNGGIPKIELNELDDYFNEFSNLKNDLFEDLNNNYCKLKQNNLYDFINEHHDIIAFKNHFSEEFKDYDKFLKDELVDNIENVDINNEEDKLSNSLFNRIKNIKFVDDYSAFQVLDDNWKIISGDLELIHDEGLSACNKTDPIIETKKKGEKEVEVQVGTKGHIIPFELIIDYKLSGLKNNIKEKEKRANEISLKISDIFDNLNEDEKSEIEDILTEDNDAFVPKELAKKAKEYLKSGISEGTIEPKIVEVNNLYEEQKNMNRELKKANEQLIVECIKETEALTPEDISFLLYRKWIEPIICGINNLVEDTINNFVKKIEELSRKYENTLKDIDEEISKTEDSLCFMLDELSGNEYDIKGLNDLKKLIKGDNNE